MTYALRYAAHSEIGLVRKNNQDSGYASPNLLVVADGMGGAAAGDLASAVAIDRIREVDRRVEGEEMLDVLSDAIRAANDRIADLVAHDHSLEGMGTTVSGALFDGTQLGLAHIGDSRAYRLREGELERLTHDHSWVQFLVDDGKISEDEAAYHPHRSLLLKVLNGQPANDPDVSLVPVQPGDRLLFCSDGLCGFVDDPVIERLLSEPELTDALDGLVAEARGEGGLDNITVIVADVIDAEDSEDEQVAAVLAAEPLVLGAATEREIPDVSVKPRVIDLGDDEESADGDPDAPVKPTAPEPSGGSSPADEADSDDEEERYAPQAPPRRRWKRPLIGMLVLVLVLVGGGAAGYAWSRTQYFVGAADEQVAIFRGLPGNLPGVALHEVYERQPLTLAELPTVYQNQVRKTISARDLEAARASVAELTRIAEQCAEEKERKKKPRSSPSPSKSAKPKGSASPKKSTKPRASATPSPSASASPSPEPTC